MKIRKYLAVHLEEYLAQVENEQGISIERWKFLEIFENFSNQYPSIEVLPAETKINYGSPDRPVIEGIEQYDIDVDIAVAGTSPENITDTLLGYECAMKKIIKDDETLGNNFLWVLSRNIPFSPLIREAKTGAVLKILAIGLMAKKKE